ncbi:TPA: FAD:protein FMN transferase [bacterium]|nr:FAD:protein FMN transferase [bacterium]
MKKILLILCLLLVACEPPSEEVKGKWINIFPNIDIIPANIPQPVDPFNTVMYVRYFIEDDDETSHDIIQEAFSEEVYRLHQLFDRHYSYYLDKENKTYINNVYQINKIYGTDEELEIDDDLINVLKLGIEYAKLSDGKFNIFVGTISDVWTQIFDDYYNFSFIEEIDPRFNDEIKNEIEKYTACIPTYEEIEDILVIDEENKTVKFNLKEVLDEEDNNICSSNSKYKPSITLGGIGKGYATKMIVEKLISLGYSNGQVLSGGSSISTLGESFLKNGQQITVADPRDKGFGEQIPAFSLRIKNKFDMSTSGNYTTGKSYSFIDYENQEIVYRHHILDSNTGLPSNYHRSVTIFSETIDAAILDALSTTLVNLPIDEGLEFRNRMKEKGLDFEVVWINQEGIDKEITCNDETWCPTYPSKLTITSTSNFNNSLKVKEGVTLKYVT